MNPIPLVVQSGRLAIEPQPGRERKLHRLKTLSPFYSAVIAGFKTFEVRFNDRGYHVGDFLLLHEYDPETDTYGRETLRQVTYIFTGGAQPSTERAAVDHVVTEGWVVMGLADVPEAKRQELYETIEVWNFASLCMRIGDLWEKIDGGEPEPGLYWIIEIAGDRRSIKLERSDGPKGGEELWVSIEDLRPARGWNHKKRGGGI